VSSLTLGPAATPVFGEERNQASVVSVAFGSDGCVSTTTGSAEFGWNRGTRWVDRFGYRSVWLGDLPHASRITV